MLLLDISADQGRIDFDALKASGLVDGVIAKATEGITYTDSFFRINHDECKRVGMPFGAYHFLHPKDDVKAQLDHFLSVTDGLGGQLLPMVDVEVADGLHFTTVIDSMVAFTLQLGLRLHQNGGTGLPIIYSDMNFLTNVLQGYTGLAGHPLWVAAYNSDATLDVTGTGWTDWTLWQYSDGSNQPLIPGISVPVDHSHVRPQDWARILR